MLETLNNPVLYWGIIAGVLQLLGYTLYIRYQGKEEIEPNPYTWLMFAYGTVLLAFLELDNIIVNAHGDFVTFALLLLPFICSLGAVVVFYLVWSRNRKLGYPQNIWWPKNTWDKGSLVIDILITICYVGIWGLSLWALMTTGGREAWAWWLLFFSNVSTFPGFVPMLLEVWDEPETEDYRPWLIWGLAYSALGIATYAEVQTLWHALMFYPLPNAIMHSLVGILAVRRPKKNIPRLNRRRLNPEPVPID